jgi:hypothetical protein
MGFIPHGMAFIQHGIAFVQHGMRFVPHGMAFIPHSIGHNPYEICKVGLMILIFYRVFDWSTILQKPFNYFHQYLYFHILGHHQYLHILDHFLAH